MLTVITAFRGLLCVASDVPRIYGADYEDYKYVCVSDMTRAKIFKDLPRGIGRILVTGIKTKWPESCASYEQAAGAEASVDDAVFQLQQELGALVAKRAVNELFVDSVKTSLKKVAANLASWQAMGLRKFACSGVEGSSVELIRLVVQQAELELEDELCLLFDSVLKIVKTPATLPKVKEVHGLVLEKLQLVQGVALHKNLMGLLETFDNPVPIAQFPALHRNLLQSLLSSPTLPADIIAKLNELGRKVIEQVAWATVVWDGDLVQMFHRFFALPQINVTGDMEVWRSFFHGLTKLHFSAVSCREQTEAAGLDLTWSLVEEFIVCFRNADKPAEACQDQELHRVFVQIHDCVNRFPPEVP